MKIKKELRRVAMLALVLVLLFTNTVGANASTGNPSIIVSDYVGLYTALEKAKDGDAIGVKGVITVPSPDALEYASVTLKRMEVGAKIIFTDTYGYGGSSTVKMIEFDGNSSVVGGRDPFVVVSGNVCFSMCEFVDCFYEGGNGGAVYLASGEAYFNACRFENNCADYGGGIFNRGTVTLNACYLGGNWAEEMGGAIYNAGTLTIKDTEIKENTARIGGGLYSNASTEIYNSLIWSNTASVHGADLANEGSLSNYTTDDEYNSRLSYYNLFYAGWADDLNTNIGGAGEYRKFLTTDVDPSAPKPTDPPVDPTDPDEGGDNTGGGEPTPPEEPDGEKPTDPTTPPDKDPVDPDPTPSDPEQGSNIDNSTTDNSTTDNSDHSTTNNNTSNNTSTDNSHSSTTTDNSSVVNNTDNSSSKSESTKTEHSNNTNTYNYYQTEQDKSSTGASQSPSQPLTINVSIPQDKEAGKGSQSPLEPSQNIHIKAEGVNVSYEYTADGVSISISPYIAPKSPVEVQAVPTSLSTIQTPQEAPESSISWVDYVSMFLLALLVLAELKDRLSLKKEA